MTLYYAIGGGLGHLTRARAVIEALSLDDAALLTASPYAGDPRVTGGLPVFRASESLAHDVSELRNWLQALFDEQRFERVILDTFPCGILGEFAGLPLPGNPPIDCVARLLSWDRYRSEVGPMRFERVWTVESLEPAHQAWLEGQAESVHALELPPLVAPDPGIELPDPCWLVVHSGPEEEILELVAYARERQALEGSTAELVVVSPLVVEGLRCLDCYPAAGLFHRAERIVTAGGFNAMRETEAFRDRHLALPFKRLFDDQFARVARRRAVGTA